MKPILLSCVLAVVSITTINAQYNQDNLALEPASQKVYQYKNLQLYPIRANKTFITYHKNMGNYLTLQEGLQKKKVLITEHVNDPTNTGGTVNTLYIENVSSDTVMVLAGEVVQGGKQDRMIAQDFLLYPNSGKKDVSVFCVEHGRWQSQGGNASFNMYYSISSNQVRKAATVAKDQQEVWKKVSETTEKNRAESSTGALAALQKSESFIKDLAAYAGYFDKLFGAEEDVIGVVAVSGDTILGCDMFATHGIFEKNYNNLINSYATEAITSGNPTTVSYEKVKEYLHSVIGDERKQDEEVEKKGTMLKDGKRKIHISTF